MEQSSGNAVAVVVQDGLRPLKALVLNSVQSPLTRAQYGVAIDQYFEWWEFIGRPPFNRATVQQHRVFLESKEYSPSTISQRLSALKRLAKEAQFANLLDQNTASGILAVESPRRERNPYREVVVEGSG